MQEEPKREGPIHLRTVGFWSRLHEVNRPLALKEVADNFKNYGIAAAFYAGGVKLVAIASGFTAAIGWLIAAVGCFFFVVTLAQSWVLAQKQAQEVVPFTVNDRIRNGWRPALKVSIYLLIPCSLGLVGVTAALWFAKNAA